MNYIPMHVIPSLAALTLASVLAGCVGISANRTGTEVRHSTGIRHSAASCGGLVAEASALASDFADSDPARVAVAHAAYAVKMAQYHACLAEPWSEPW